MPITNMVKGVIVGVVGLVLLISIVGATIGTVVTAGNTINATGYPLASLFASNSILPILFLGAALVATVALAFSYVKANK